MRLTDYDKLQLKLREYADKKAANGEIELANGILKAKCFIDQECEIINEKQLNGGWISVSERLPDNNTKVQVTGVRYSEYTKKNIYVRFNAKYIGKHSIKVDDTWSYCEDYTWNDYVEEEDEYYVNEGWYETIENWDDYTELYVSDYKVIAWQPLPEPCEEVENE